MLSDNQKKNVEAQRNEADGVILYKAGPGKGPDRLQHDAERGLSYTSRHVYGPDAAEPLLKDGYYLSLIEAMDAYQGKVKEPAKPASAPATGNPQKK